MGVQGLIYILIAICVIAAIALAGVLFYVWLKDRKRENGTEDLKAGITNKRAEATTKLQGIESMSKFLDFEEVVDSMIVRKKRTQYVMVIQCKGINYDLLGQDEKIAVENGFIQFLNTLRFPIQLYIQTRSVNLRDSIEQYERKVAEVREDVIKLEAQIKKEKANGRMELVRKHEADRRRKLNILEYGEDITGYVAKMSQNRNVLQQNTYVVVAYYTSEFGGDISNYSKEEVDNIAFSELYTRAQTLIRGLASSGVVGRVINSEELTDLLYIAYNRDDSELISVRKAVESQYDSLYNTARDVYEKQKEIIEEKVDKEAIELAANSITKADKILKLKQQSKELIRQRAMQYVEQYKNEMTDELYEETKKQVGEAEIEDETESSSKVETSKATTSKPTSSKREEALKKRREEVIAKRKAALLEKRRAEALARKKAQMLEEKKSETAKPKKKKDTSKE